MQDLGTYLSTRPKGEFADRVNINRSYLSQILSRKRLPSYDLMVRIERATNGAVPLASWADWKQDAA